MYEGEYLLRNKEKIGYFFMIEGPPSYMLGEGARG
jgi:hypothetical protein